ncbi:hypothetical protein [Sediminibacterium sp.]|uniref:hypothetical protein n=1 Tax=Sediminibacterium sp. TaxID=1917865 RepID=UPI0026006FAE|nr:hypothetical protein [Sediminibacterium sp.]MBW0179115.1 hypothetical protein [Sediminibacterium sp.]
MRKISLIIFVIVYSLSASAQKNVILEQVRTFSMLGPVMNYFSLPDTRSTFIKQLNDQLLAKKNARINDTILRVITLENLKQYNTASVYFTNADTATHHLYIDIYEYEPNTFYYSQPDYLQDSLLFKRTKSVFQLGILFVNHEKKIIRNDVLTICVSPGSSNGFGLIPSNLSVTPKGFTDLLNLGIGRLLDEQNNTDMIEIKAPPAFYADNFILPEISKHPVLQTRSQKDIFTYQRNGESEMIRLGDTFYEELIAKGKKKNIPDNSEIANAINATGNLNSSDFVQLRQECRDVLRDKNYTLKLVTEINPNFSFISQADVFTQFLPGLVHTLLKDKDTIARFIIQKNIGIPEKKIFVNKITNGYDSSSTVTISGSSVPRNVLFEYLVIGIIGEQPFVIRCSDRNSLKEIRLNDKEVAVAKGIYLPERIAVFDASLEMEKLNQLLMIAFSKFYQ